MKHEVHFFSFFIPVGVNKTQTENDNSSTSFLPLLLPTCCVGLFNKTVLKHKQTMCWFGHIMQEVTYDSQNKNIENVLLIIILYFCWSQICNAWLLLVMWVFLLYSFSTIVHKINEKYLCTVL